MAQGGSWRTICLKAGGDISVFLPYMVHYYSLFAFLIALSVAESLWTVMYVKQRAGVKENQGFDCLVVDTNT